MELKILCDCGQKFKFDVEPINGSMPFPVACPVCNQDGTAKANSMIAEKLGAAPEPAVVAPSPIAPASGGLRIHRADPEMVLPAPPLVTSSNDSAPPAIGAVHPFAVAVAQNPSRKTSFGMGLLGGFIGALVGSLLYFLIFKYTGLRFKLLALGVGALGGWFADFLGKGDGSKELGGITAVLVISGVIGAQYLVALGWWHGAIEARQQYAQSAYANAVIEANDMVKIVPNGSDAEIRAYLVKQSADAGIKLQPADISGDDVKDFRENQLTEYRGLANGQITKDKYDASHDIKAANTQADEDSEQSTFKGLFLLLFVTKGNIFALVAAAALAFKLSTNA
jgi:hypothetical protein